MATQAEIAELRDLIAEPDDSNGWTDERLGAYIDRAQTLNGAASAVWGSKAASLSTMVNVSESGSSRSLGDLFKNASAMRDYYKGLEDATLLPEVDYPVIARIRRAR